MSHVDKTIKEVETFCKTFTALAEKGNAVVALCEIAKSWKKLDPSLIGSHALQYASYEYADSAGIYWGNMIAVYYSEEVGVFVEINNEVPSVSTMNYTVPDFLVSLLSSICNHAVPLIKG